MHFSGTPASVQYPPQRINPWHPYRDLWARLVRPSAHPQTVRVRRIRLSTLNSSVTDHFTRIAFLRPRWHPYRGLWARLVRQSARPQTVRVRRIRLSTLNSFVTNLVDLWTNHLTVTDSVSPPVLADVWSLLILAILPYLGEGRARRRCPWVIVAY